MAARNFAKRGFLRPFTLAQGTTADANNRLLASALALVLELRPLHSSARVASSTASSGAEASQGPQPGSVIDAEAAAHVGEAAAGSQAAKRPSRLLTALKLVAGLTTTALCGAAAYTTYAFDSNEVDEKLRPWRETVAYESEPLHTLEKGGLAVAEWYLDTRRAVEDYIHGFQAPSSNKLLPDLAPQEQHVYTLVVDLNETLVYSDWKRERGWRTFKRPGVDAFLEKMAQYFEIVVYSDQTNLYVDPILERLDPRQCIRYRLYRDATQWIHGKHMRDFAKLNRRPERVMFLSAHAKETSLQPEVALPITAWKGENTDTALLDLIPFLEFLARQRPPDTRVVLKSYEGQDIPTAFKERSKEVAKRMQERKRSRFLW